MTDKDARRALPEPERRKYPRKRTLFHAQLQTPAGDFDCRVVSLSHRGARIEIDHPVAHKQVVTLILEPLGEFTGFVAWCHDGSIGIRINEHCTTRKSISLPRWVAESDRTSE